MKIISTNGQPYASAEVTKSIQSLMFVCKGNISSLTSETISIKATSGINGKPLYITDGFVNLKKFLLASTAGVTHGSDSTNGMLALVSLTTGGFLPLNANVVLKIELNGCTSEFPIEVLTFQSSFPATRAHTYQALNANKESESFDIDVSSYDILVLPVVVDVTEYILTYNNELQANYTPFELKSLLNASTPPISIGSDGSVLQCLEDFIILPLTGFKSIQIRKKKNSEIEMFFRLNVFN